jgi:hypothetical protein
VAVTSRDLYWHELSVISGRAVITKEDTTLQTGSDHASTFPGCDLIMSALPGSG